MGVCVSGCNGIVMAEKMYLRCIGFKMVPVWNAYCWKISCRFDCVGFVIWISGLIFDNIDVVGFDLLLCVLQVIEMG